MVAVKICKNYCLAHFFWNKPGSPRGQRPAPATPGHGLFMACSFRPLYLSWKPWWIWYHHCYDIPWRINVWYIYIYMYNLPSIYPLYVSINIPAPWILWVWKPPNWKPQISSPITASGPNLYSSVVSLRGGIVQRCDSWAETLSVATSRTVVPYIFSKEDTQRGKKWNSLLINWNNWDILITRRSN